MNCPRCFTTLSLSAPMASNGPAVNDRHCTGCGLQGFIAPVNVFVAITGLLLVPDPARLAAIDLTTAMDLPSYQTCDKCGESFPIAENNEGMVPTRCVFCDPKNEFATPCPI